MDAVRAGGMIARVITARPPTARTASAIAGASVATRRARFRPRPPSSRCARSWFARDLGQRLVGQARGAEACRNKDERLGHLGLGRLRPASLARCPPFVIVPPAAGKTIGGSAGACAAGPSFACGFLERRSLRRRGRGNAHCQNPSRAAKQRAPRGRPARVKLRSCALVLPSKARRARHDGY